jgi:hypothetical protein
MMIKFRNIVFILTGLVSLLLAGCEKNITVDLPRPDPKIVIEGYIEEGMTPYVIVSRNVPYFEPIDTGLIDRIMVSGARVIVSNGILTDTLYDLSSLTSDSINLKGYYFGSKFVGEVGRTYSLRVEVEGKTYTSVTTIPEPVPLDSIKFKPEDPADNDTSGVLWIYLVDPPVLGNYYRFYTHTTNRDQSFEIMPGFRYRIFVHPFPSTTDDRLFNDQKAEYSIYRGRNPMQDNLYNDDGKDVNGYSRWLFYIGDTVIIKFSSIDFHTYDFWYSVEMQMSSDGNPFSSPASAKGNITGDALGVWGGYGIYWDTIVVKKDTVL